LVGLRVLDEVVEQQVEHTIIVVDVGVVLLALLISPRPLGHTEQLRETIHHIERCAYLVTHVLQKLRLALIKLLASGCNDKHIQYQHRQHEAHTEEGRCEILHLHDAQQ